MIAVAASERGPHSLGDDGRSCRRFFFRSSFVAFLLFSFSSSLSSSGGVDDEAGEGNLPQPRERLSGVFDAEVPQHSIPEGASSAVVAFFSFSSSPDRLLPPLPSPALAQRLDLLPRPRLVPRRRSAARLQSPRPVLEAAAPEPLVAGADGDNDKAEEEKERRAGALVGVGSSSCIMIVAARRELLGESEGTLRRRRPRQRRVKEHAGAPARPK